MPTNPPSPDHILRWVADARDLLREVAGRLWVRISTGRATRPQRRTIVGRLMDAGREKLANLSRLFAEGLKARLMTLAGWARRFADMVAPQHYAAVMAALGTIDPKPADLEATHKQVMGQLRWLDRFREDIRTGRQVILAPPKIALPAPRPAFAPTFTDGGLTTASRRVTPIAPPTTTAARVASAQFLNRSGMYADASWGVVEGVLRDGAIRDGYTEERRLLGGLTGSRSRHCQECPELAAMGWVPLNSLPAVGQTPCRTRCRCSWQWR